jgi:predicted enzyme related to lactoylglutathione lyase
MTWNDLVTADADTAAAFYAGLFGWEFEAVEGAHGYRVIRNGGRSNGGIMPLSPEMASSTPPAWMPYFGHRDVDALATGIGGHGGTVFQEPFAVLAGRVAVFGDPQGAAFAVWTGPYDD